MAKPVKAGRSARTETFAVVTEQQDGMYLAFSAVTVRKLLSRELFADVAGLAGQHDSRGVLVECRSRWETLANRLAASQWPIECIMLVGIPEPGADRPHRVCQAFISVGRGRSRNAAVRRAKRAVRELDCMISLTFDQVEVEPVTDNRELRPICALLKKRHVMEVSRRVESIRPWHGRSRRNGLGFRSSGSGDVDEPHAPERDDDGSVRHLFPWTPGDDGWEHLLAALLRAGTGTAFVVHLKGHERTPDEIQQEAVAALAVAEQIARLQVSGKGVQTILSIQAELLRREALKRVSMLQGRVVEARLFVTSRCKLSQSLLTAVLTGIDATSSAGDKRPGDGPLHGGAQVDARRARAVTAPLKSGELRHFFGLHEATSFFRTAIPAVSEMPGLSLKRARTLAITGLPGTDCLLGRNLHRGVRVDACVDEGTRFRATYVIGQTGTGKSTLLLNMVMHDVNAGRGVAVLDPHGSLVDDVLRCYHQHRRDDLVLVDLSDSERPVGLNILHVAEEDPLVYRHTRDMIIDDLYSFLQRTYMQETMGPIFESHLRSVLALLMGNETQKAPLIPNLMLFRTMYTNRKLRKALSQRVRGQDVVVDEFLDEADAVCGEGSMANMAPYITSKFSRFVTDVALRNITCQPRTLDFDDIVNSGKVLLVYLGKGKFGDHAAGLLAGQIVSRLRHAVMKRGSSQNNRPFYLYADEFQLFADERFAELLAEARKFGLALTLAHQYVEQLPERVLRAVVGNVGTLIALRVGARDGEFLAPLFRPHFSARDLMSQANFRACVKSSGRLGETPFSLDLVPPPSGQNATLARRLRTLSRNRYGQCRRKVEDEIAKTYLAYRELGSELSIES